MLISSFPSAIFWRGWFFPVYSFNIFAKSKVVYICVSFYLSPPFAFINLCIISLSDLGRVLWHFYYCGPVVYVWIRYGCLLLWSCSRPLDQVWKCFKHYFCFESLCLARVFCAAIWIFTLVFYFSEEWMVLEFWWGLCWACRLLLVGCYFHNINSPIPEHGSHPDF